MIVRTVIAGLLAILPGIAQATVYDCKVNSGEFNGGWLTEQYVFEYVDGQPTVLVFDPLISHFNKETPVEGKVSSKNDAKVSFRWGVLVTNTAQQRTKLDFRAVLFLATNEFSVQANPIGYTNKFHARGVCSVAQ